MMACCSFGFSNLSEVTVFLQRNYGWNESDCSAEMISLEKSFIGMRVFGKVVGNVLACTRHGSGTGLHCGHCTKKIVGWEN